MLGLHYAKGVQLGMERRSGIDVNLCEDVKSEDTVNLEWQAEEVNDSHLPQY